MADKGVDGSVVISIDGDAKGFEKSIADVENKSKGLNDVLNHAFGNLLSDAIETSAEQLQRLSEEVYNTGVSFESAFAGVKKTVDETADYSYDRIYGELREMAKEVPATFEEIAGVAEAAGQLGIKTEALTDFTSVMIDLGNSTNLSAEQAAVSLAQLANITKMSSDDYGRLGATIVDLGNNMATTEADIVAMSQRIASVGTVAGLSEAEIMAISAALGSVGVSAEVGGTAMSTFIKKMQTAVAEGGTKLEKFAEIAGMTAEDFQAKFKEDAMGAITSFIEGLHNLDTDSVITSLKELGITDTRLSNAILALSTNGEILSKAVGIANTAWEENTALVEEASKRYETRESKMQIMLNQFRDLYADLYATVSSSGLTGSMDGIQVSLDKLRDALKGDLGDKIKGLAEKLGVLAEKFADYAANEGIDKLVDALIWIVDHAEAAAAIIGAGAKEIGTAAKYVAEFAIVYAGLSKMSGVVTTVSGVAKAIAGAGSAAAAAAPLMAALPWAIIAAGAIVAATAIADYIDEQAKLIGYEGEVKEAFNDTNKSIVEQNNLLSDLAEDDLEAAYKQAKDEIDDYTDTIANNNKRLDYLKKQRDHINEGWTGLSATGQAEATKQLDDINQQIAGLEEQNQRLELGIITRKGIIDRYESSTVRFSSGESERINQLAEQHRLEAQEYAERNKRAAKQQAEVKQQQNLEDQWAILDHERAMGIIASDQELYTRRLALLKQYGDESNKEHWKYYEEVHKYEVNLTEQQKKDADDAANKRAENIKNAETIVEKAIEDAQSSVINTLKSKTSSDLNAFKSGLNEINRTYENSTQEILNQREKYRQELMGSGIFSVTEEEDKRTGERTKRYVINNLQEMLEERKRYAENIAALENRDISSGLMAELEALSGEDKAAFAEILAKMSDADFKELNEGYKALEEIASSAANDRYADELDQAAADKISNTVSLGLTTGFEVAKEYFDTNGTIGEAFAQSLADGVKDGSEDLLNAIDEVLQSRQFDITLGTDLNSMSAYASSAGADQAAKIMATATDGQAAATGQRSQTINVEVAGKLTADGDTITAMVNSKNAKAKITSNG